MRKVFPFVLVLALLLSFAGTALADAPAPGGPFSSSFNIQNLTTGSIECVVTYYDANGAEAATSDQLPASIAAEDKAYVYVPSEGSLGSGAYSAMISCSGEVAAVSNFSDQPNSQTEASGASYSGITDQQTADTWYTPNVYNNYYNFYTNIVVQNAGASSTNVTVSIYAPGSSTAVHTLTKTGLASNASYTFELEGVSQLSSNVSYSAKVEGGSGSKLAVITNIYGRSTYNNQLYSFNAFTAGATTVYAPVIMNNYYGYDTDFTIQNLGTSNANVTITYYYRQGGVLQTKTQNLVIAPNSSDANYTPVESGVPSTGNLVVTAVAESTGASPQPIIGVINESKAATNRAASYSGFTAGATTIRAPIIYKNFYGYDTSITCMNVGSGTAATFSVDYVADAASGTSATQETSPSVEQYEAHQFYQPANSSLNDSYNGAAKISSTTVPFACVINEDITSLTNPATSYVRDTLYTYNAVGQ
jgi:hypothetical protein